jgi:DNA-binding response OmpR family regulator
LESNRLSAGRRVLIVDDEKVITATLSWIFTARGYDTRTSYSAEDTLALLNSWLPDLALIDVSLPEMNGVDLAIRMKGLCPECRLLLMSGKPDSMEILDTAGRNGHVLELVAKPVSPKVLLDRVAELLACSVAS